MRFIVGNFILLLATAEIRGGPYLKLLQDALRIGERAREGDAFDGIKKDLGEAYDGIKKDLETNVDFQLRWLGLRWNDTGELVLACDRKCSRPEISAEILANFQPKHFHRIWSFSVFRIFGRKWPFRLKNGMIST